VPSYLVETYLSRTRAVEGADRERRADAAARELTESGTPVRFACSINVPADETCFFVLEAPSLPAAERAAQVAGLDPVRVVEAITSAAQGTTSCRPWATQGPASGSSQQLLPRHQAVTAPGKDHP